MSDLTDARDHARKMAAASGILPASAYKSAACLGLFQGLGHASCSGVSQVGKRCPCACHPKPAPSPQDVALWTRLADEIDAYLTHDDDHPTIEGT